jgi:Cytochrome P460
MRLRIVAITLITATAILLQTSSVRAEEGTVAYPDGYRAWTFLHGSLVPAAFSGFSKSPCVKPCTNGMFYFYANEKAMKGLKSGNYPDGAVIAEEMLEFKIGDKGVGGEGHRVLTAVMVKNNQLYPATDGWGYCNFDEGSKANTLDAKAQQACHQCHISRKDHGYVFSQYVER